MGSTNDPRVSGIPALPQPLRSTLQTITGRRAACPPGRARSRVATRHLERVFAGATHGDDVGDGQRWGTVIAWKGSYTVQVRVTRFTRQERAFIREPNWFAAIRMLEREPHLVTADFGTRLAAAARMGLPDAKLRPYDAMARLMDNILMSGFASAARIQLGAGGVLAGEAREARDRYYAVREPQHLMAALSLFASALECYDDPIVFDQGRTLHGIGATLLDLHALHRSAATGIVGTLAFFASIAALISITGNKATDVQSWYAIRKASRGARTHIDTLGLVGVTGQAEAFRNSADRACAGLEVAIANRSLNRAAAVSAGFCAGSLAIACSRVRLGLPSESDSESEQWHPVQSRLLQAIHSMNCSISLSNGTIPSAGAQRSNSFARRASQAAK